MKYYPAGATTHSDAGVCDIRKCDLVLEAMQAAGMPLLVHGEVTDADVDVFDREAVFLDRTLGNLVRRFPTLRIVVEHITTHEAAVFVERAGENVAATITAHHLLMNRNAIFAGGLNPHHYCLPILKREPHRRALVKAATSGSPKFFLGTDSAPHGRERKESCCGAAGMYTAHAALELYAEAFEAAGALDRLEGFASHYGADFYGLPRKQGQGHAREAPLGSAGRVRVRRRDRGCPARGTEARLALRGLPVDWTGGASGCRPGLRALEPVVARLRRDLPAPRSDALAGGTNAGQPGLATRGHDLGRKRGARPE